MAANYDLEKAPPTGRHLVINTFGKATLSGKRVEVKTNEPTKYPIGTDGFEYNLRVNTSGTIDIQFRDDVGATINVQMSDKVVTQIRITPDCLQIGPNYSLAGDQLTQKFITSEPIFTRSTFQLVLLQSEAIRRVDLRYSNYSWVTMLIYNNRIMTVTLNGSDLANSLQRICGAAVDYGVSTQRESLVPSKNFGLSMGYKSHEDRVKNIAPNTPGNPKTADLPRLIPFNELPRQRKNRTDIEEAEKLKKIEEEEKSEVNEQQTEYHTQQELAELCKTPSPHQWDSACESND